MSEPQDLSTTEPPAEPGAMPRGDLPGWEQVLAEDFDTPAPTGTFTSSRYARTFLAYDGLPDTSGRGVYSPGRVLSVADGALDWWVHTADGEHRVAAVVPHPADRWGWTYGRYEIRFRADTLPGYKLVGILWPDSDNWGEGEINFPEVHELVSDQLVYANLFPPGDLAARQPGPATSSTTTVAANDTGWHVATIEWRPGSITTWLDGEPVVTFTEGVPATSMHLVLQVETTLDGPPPADDVQGHVQVDWVTLYAPAGDEG